MRKILIFFGKNLKIPVIVLVGASSSVLSFLVVCWVEIQNYSIWYTSKVLSQFYSVPCLVLIAYSSSIMLMYTILDVHRSNAVYVLCLCSYLANWLVDFNLSQCFVKDLKMLKAFIGVFSSPCPNAAAPLPFYFL